MKLKILLPVLALTSLAMLGACDRADDGRTVVQQIDRAAAHLDRKADDAGRAVAEAAEQVGDKAKDISISAEVKAQLARDDQLGERTIDVHTVNGQVTLRGSAPDAPSRERAATLANSISGVVAVDNQLVVAPRT